MASPSDEVDLSLSLGNGPNLGRKRKKRDDSNPNLDEEGRNVDFGDRRSGLGRCGFDLRRRGGFDGGEVGKEVSCGGSNPNLKESDGFDGEEVGKKGVFDVQGRRSCSANPNLKPDLVKSNSNPNPNLKANVVDKSNCVGNVLPCASFPVVTMPCLPFGYPCMVPWWNVPVPAGSEGAKVGKNVFQPVAIRGFHHFSGHGVNRNGVFAVGGGGASDGESNGAKSTSIFQSTSLTPSQGSSFSAVSDFQSGGSGSNSSCDTRAHSNPASDEKHPPNSSSQIDKSLQRPHPIVPSEPVQAPRKFDAEPTDSNQAFITLNSISRSNSIQKPRSTFVHHENPTTTPVRTNSIPLPEMPCVTTTGNGPNGKTITGFLYRYNRTEVSIVCVCHGSSFSPAEFIKHAGGTEVSHPLRHIVIVPS